MANARLIKLMEVLKELESEKEVLDKKEHAILNEIKKPKKDRPTKEDLVVAFVKEIEKTYQFFEFKEYLKQNTELLKNWGKFAIFEQLVENKVHHTYDKLDVKDILDAVQDVKDTLAAVQERYEPAVLNPLTKLVQAMKAGHIVDEDPYEELLKIKKDDAFFYQKSFVWKLFQNNSATKVIVRYVPEEFTEDTVKELLSGCGDVVSVDFDVELGNKIANVTFGDSVSAKIAPIFMARKAHTVLPFPEVDLPPVPSIEEYQDALNKYAVFRNHNNISNASTAYRNNISNASTAESPVDMLLG